MKYLEMFPNRSPDNLTSMENITCDLISKITWGQFRVGVFRQKTIRTLTHIQDSGFDTQYTSSA